MGEAQAQIALQLGGIEHVQGPAEVHSDQVGDVDQGRDRPQADRGKALLQPGRARPVAHAAQHPADEQRAGRRVAFREIERDLKRRIKLRGYRAEITMDQRADAGRGELARDAEHAEAVAAVGGDRDVDHRPLDPDHLVRRAPDRRIRRQLDDPGMVLAEQKLARRAQHAAAVDAPDLRLLERLAALRNHGADRGEHRLHAGMDVGRAADHLDPASTGVDLAKIEPLGVRMTAHGEHLRDPERRQVGAPGLDVLDLEAEHGQARDDLIEARLGRQMLLQPGQGELHRDRPP